MLKILFIILQSDRPRKAIPQIINRTEEEISTIRYLLAIGKPLLYNENNPRQEGVICAKDSDFQYSKSISHPVGLPLPDPAERVYPVFYGFSNP